MVPRHRGDRRRDRRDVRAHERRPRQEHHGARPGTRPGYISATSTSNAITGHSGRPDRRHRRVGLRHRPGRLPADADPADLGQRQGDVLVPLAAQRRRRRGRRRRRPDLHRHRDRRRQAAHGQGDRHPGRLRPGFSTSTRSWGSSATRRRRRPTSPSAARAPRWARPGRRPRRRGTRRASPRPTSGTATARRSLGATKGDLQARRGRHRRHRHRPSDRHEGRLRPGTSVSNEVIAEQLDTNANIAPPTITGVAAARETLTANPGTWPGGTTYSYQWFVNGLAVAKETRATYVVRTRDAGLQVSVRVTGSKTGYLPGEATSTSDDSQEAGDRDHRRRSRRRRSPSVPGRPQHPRRRRWTSASRSARFRSRTARRCSRPCSSRATRAATVIRLKKLKPGKHKLVVSYLGSVSTDASKAKKVKLIVLKVASSEQDPMSFSHAETAGPGRAGGARTRVRRTRCAPCSAPPARSVFGGWSRSPRSRSPTTTPTSTCASGTSSSARGRCAPGLREHLRDPGVGAHPVAAPDRDGQDRGPGSVWPASPGCPDCCSCPWRSRSTSPAADSPSRSSRVPRRC